MNFGICTRYSHHEATFAAIRIGNWLRRHGHEASLFTMTCCPPKLDTYWDRKLRRELDFSAWIAEDRIEAVLTTHVPSAALLAWLSGLGIPLYVLGLWHELEPSDRGVLAGVTTVLAPHTAGYQYLRSWGLRNVMPLPWDTGEPFFTKPQDYEIDQPKVYLPLYDGLANRMEMTTLDVVGRALLRNPQAQFTIVYSSSTICSAAKRCIGQLAKEFKQQLTVKKAVPVKERPLLFQQHDLTLWPTEYESTCMVGLSSATMGTPVMACKVPPIHECFNDDNAIYVTSQWARDNALGLPRAVPDYAMMDELLHQALRDPCYLRELQRNTMTGLPDRRIEFNHTMQQLVS